jgi:hypothetical protein
MRGAHPRAVHEVAMSEQTQPTNNFMTWTLAVLAPFTWTTKLVAAAILGLIAPILMTLLGLAAVLLAFTAVLFHFAAPQAGPSVLGDDGDRIGLCDSSRPRRSSRPDRFAPLN